MQGGSLYVYPGFSPALDFAQLHNDLRWNVARPQGLEAVARLRVSNGLTVVGYQGAFCKRTPTDVDLPTVDCDKALLVTLACDEKLAVRARSPARRERMRDADLERTVACAEHECVPLAAAPQDGAEVGLQFAMLYTTMAGERRIRVHTMTARVRRYYDCITSPAVPALTRVRSFR